MNEALDEFLKQAGATRSIAGGLFKQENLAAMYNIPSISDHIRGTFGADRLIDVIAQDIEAWKQKVPTGKHLVVHMRTPQGDIMDVGLVKPVGWQGFAAEGHVNGLPCMVTGHIATLLLFCTYEETKGTKSVGFKIVTEAANATQKEHAPSTPDSE